MWVVYEPVPYAGDKLFQLLAEVDQPNSQPLGSWLSDLSQQKKQPLLIAVRVESTEAAPDVWARANGSNWAREVIEYNALKQKHCRKP